MDLELLPDLLREVFGSHIALERYEIAKSRNGYVVLLADLAHPTLSAVIKLAKLNAPYACPFDRVAALHARVRTETTVPVAEVHTIRFGAFGALDDNAESATGFPYLRTLSERARKRIPNIHKSRFFTKVLQEHAGLFAEAAQPRLCHDDLHKHNILFNRKDGEWRLSAILDFDSAYAGHHESDLARLDLWRGMIGPGFWEAYREIIPVSPLYVQRRPIHQLLWCLEYGSMSPQHKADTREVCTQLGLEE